MEELDAKGDRFTWSGKRGNHWVQCCLDRCFGNKEWFKLFPSSNQTFMDKRGSDHRPVWVKFRAMQDRFRGQFRFDKRLMLSMEVKKEVEGAWSCARGDGSLSSKITNCRKVLSGWKKKRIFNAKDKINLLQQRLEWFESKPYQCRFMVNNLKKELIRAYKEEEMFWWQKSRDKWLTRGDRNTDFFHNSVKVRRSSNQLTKLKNSHGVEQRSDGAKAEVAIEYFTNLFESSNPSSYEDAFASMIPKVTVNMNASLLLKVSKEEVREAIFSIKPESAPGPDGMNGLFFQKYWNIIGEDVTKEIMSVFESGTMPSEWNFTYLCLIPKVPDPENMIEIRPISLCSVLYKAVSNIMVKRLQPFLKDLVSPNQSAFVSDRSITDNILIAHEAVHALRTHTKTSKEYMAIKTDMSKAYDRVEWSYICSLLKAMGFDSVWVNLIMMCISTVTYAVLINDQPFGLISPKRGIRQGDPLSPFLFVLCSEGLSHLLEVAERNGFLEGMKFHEAGPSIHHLFFADDSLFICKASCSQGRNLKRILNYYGEATGQVINLQKSSLTFGNNIPELTKMSLKRIFGIYQEGGASKYLGLPECFSGSKVDLLEYLKDRTQNRLEAWYIRNLSQGGKEVLIKSTASAIPSFAMASFRLPKTLLKKLASIMANFWWSSDPNQRKIHWVSWEKLCLPKNLGGMGFRELECFNQAMLAKQGWNMITQPEGLLQSFLKSRYFPTGDFLYAAEGIRPSFGWRSLLHGRALLIKGLQKRIGNGENTCVWTDRWVNDPVEGLRAPWMMNNHFEVNHKVASLIDNTSKRWNVEALLQVFAIGDIEILLRNQPAVNREDFYAWKFNKSGKFSVKSAYWLACDTKTRENCPEMLALPSLNPLKDSIWKVLTAPKIRIFIWKSLSDAISVADLLSSRGVKMDSRCQICGNEGESINHLLFQCTLSRQVWAEAGIPQPEFGFHETSIYQNISYLVDLKKRRLGVNENKRAWPWIIWRIWKSRNEFLFKGYEWSAKEIAQKAFEDSEEWFLAQTMEEEITQAEPTQEKRENLKWSPPPKDWTMCNIGYDWNKHSRILGVAWVVRNHRGVVLFHSRSSFAQIPNKEEARLQAILWAVESMASLKLSKVVFAGQFKEEFEAVMKPMDWPLYAFQSGEISKALLAVKDAQLLVVYRNSNRCASLIATSVTRENRHQSYVASGPPCWLFELFVNESRFL
ncbi:uncharacterized protein LOC106434754 [Brassica napus]|uniref:uncharacterized protein LOC106434754 n=1 Tax=Brassica napus TaxID=3708 RepID=UPI002079C9EB|nr:uncharacterized protein LOC106434754 [Brassica napus]